MREGQREEHNGENIGSNVHARGLTAYAGSDYTLRAIRRWYLHSQGQNDVSMKKRARGVEKKKR